MFTLSAFCSQLAIEGYIKCVYFRFRCTKIYFNITYVFQLNIWGRLYSYRVENYVIGKLKRLITVCLSSWAMDCGEEGNTGQGLRH